MENAPHLELDFDPRRLFLADLNGTGCADLVYVAFDRVHFWFNRSGNSWSDAPNHPRNSNDKRRGLDSIRRRIRHRHGDSAVELRLHSAQPEGNYKALDFCGGVKPYVLTEMSNNMGATTRVSYAPSTRYFLEDQASGTPWVTKLPFPVQVVDKVEVIDHISKTKLVTTYKYHHGYFDGREREFRGFGRVDQFDTETFEDFAGPASTAMTICSTIRIGLPRAAGGDPLVVSHRHLFRRGRRRGARSFRLPRADERVPQGVSTRDDQRPCRSTSTTSRPARRRTRRTGHCAERCCAPRCTRTTAAPKPAHPYQVTENRYRVKQLQPKGRQSSCGLFQPSTGEPELPLRAQPDRSAHQPRADAGGGRLRQSAEDDRHRLRPPAARPALPTQADRDKQTRTLITYTENSYTNAIDDPLVDPDNYRTPLPSESRTYELTGFTPASDAQRFSVDEWVANDFARLKEAGDPLRGDGRSRPNAKAPDRAVRKRYRKDDLTDLLPLGALESLALPGESYKLAFTHGCSRRSTATRVSDSILAEDGGYVHSEGDDNWWIPSGGFFIRLRSPTRQPKNSRLRSDISSYRTAPAIRSETASSRVTTRTIFSSSKPSIHSAIGSVRDHDYRVLQPFRVTDPNGNRAEVAFDTLGLVAGTAVMGKATETRATPWSDSCRT